MTCNARDEATAHSGVITQSKKDEATSHCPLDIQTAPSMHRSSALQAVTATPPRGPKYIPQSERMRERSLAKIVATGKPSETVAFPNSPRSHLGHVELPESSVSIMSGLCPRHTRYISAASAKQQELGAIASMAAELQRSRLSRA